MPTKKKVAAKIKSVKTKAAAAKATVRDRGGVKTVKAPPLLRDIFYDQFQTVFCKIVSAKQIDPRGARHQRFVCLMTLGRSKSYVQDTIVSESGASPRPGEAWKFHTRALEPGAKRVPVGTKV